jgi:hypothetical protein
MARLFYNLVREGEPGAGDLSMAERVIVSDFRRPPCPIKYRSFLDIVGHGSRWRVFCGVSQGFRLSIQAIHGLVCLTAGIVPSCGDLFASFGIALWHCGLRSRAF